MKKQQKNERKRCKKRPNEILAPPSILAEIYTFFPIFIFLPFIKLQLLFFTQNALQITLDKPHGVIGVDASF